jgi:hypothetical protein
LLGLDDLERRIELVLRLVHGARVLGEAMAGQVAASILVPFLLTLSTPGTLLPSALSPLVYQHFG